LKNPGCLPIGGRYPDEILLKCKIDGRHFGALIYHPEDPWAVTVRVVEEIHGHKKHGMHYYREATSLHMFFINGRIGTRRECLEWGVDGLDGYDLRMYGFDEWLGEYIEHYPEECGHLNGKLFDSMQDALEYYSAWETKEERIDRIKRERRELKAFNKYT